MVMGEAKLAEGHEVLGHHECEFWHFLGKRIVTMSCRLLELLPSGLVKSTNCWMPFCKSSDPFIW